MDSVRIPLSSQPGNSPSLKSKSIRRKSTFARNSSDTIPSSHTSIFDAEYLSGSDEISQRLETWISINTSDRGIHQHENTNHPPIIPKIGMTPILYGNGTQLATIVEQKSSTTMETEPGKVSLSVNLSRPSSTSALSQLSNAIGSQTPTFLTAQDSFDSSDSLLRPERTSRRQKSYSADDLALLKGRKSYQETCAMIEKATQKRAPVHKTYADPQAPLIPPIKRPDTPLGAPSWNEGQGSTIFSPAPNEGHSSQQRQHVSFRAFIRNDFFLFWNTPQRISGQHRQRSIRRPLHRSASKTVPIRGAPRFRPIRSGHGIGPLHSHPFFIDPPTSPKVDSPPALVNTSIRSQYNNTTSTNMLSTGHTGSLGGIQMRVDASNRVGFTPKAPQTRSFAVPARNHPSASMIRLDGVGMLKKKCSHSKKGKISLNDARQALPTKFRWKNLLGCRQRAVSDPTQRSIAPACLDAQESTTPIRVVVQHPDYEPLMSGGGPDDTHAEHKQPCWSCCFINLNNNFNQAWEESTDWFCWFCCGVEMNDIDKMESHELMGPRQVVVEEGVS